MHNIIPQMRQPYSRGSPRPRGYIHQVSYSFYLFTKIEYLQSHVSSMASLPYHKALRREPLVTKQPPFLYNHLIKGFKSSLGHSMNVNYNITIYKSHPP